MTAEISAAAEWAATTEAVVEGSFQAGRDITFTMQAQSMHPMLMAGDKIVVSPAGAEILKIGDIVLRKAEYGSGWLAHRVIGLSRREERFWLETKGDNNQTADAEWDAAKLLGVVTVIQSGAKVASLKSRRAEWANSWIAKLSPRQAVSNRSRPSALRSFALKSLGLSIYGVGRIARFSLGLG